MKSFKFEQMDNEHITSKYAFLYFMFGFLSKPKEGTVIQCAKLDYCREILNNYIRRYIRCIECETEARVNVAFDHYGNKALIRKNMDLSKLRLLVYNKTNNDSWNGVSEILLKRLQNGVNILNILEERNNWPLTKIFDLEKGNLSDKHFLKMLIASKKWIRSPYMFSLFMLIIKVCSEADIFENVKIYEDIIDQCKKIDGNTYNKKNKSIFKYIRTTYKVWDLMLRKYDYLFRGFSMHDNYINTCFSNGIHKLCDGLVKGAVARRFKCLCNKENIKLGD